MPDVVLKVKSLSSIAKNDQGNISLRQFVGELLAYQTDVQLPQLAAVNKRNHAAENNSKARLGYFGKQMMTVMELFDSIDKNDDKELSAEEVAEAGKKYNYNLSEKDNFIPADSIHTMYNDTQALKHPVTKKSRAH
jgi:hypothetical protein